MVKGRDRRHSAITTKDYNENTATKSNSRSVMMSAIEITSVDDGHIEHNVYEDVPL